MIYNLRGTSGSGKSTLVREIMERYGKQQELFIDGRKQPIGQLLHRDRSSFVVKPPLFVPGHYRTPCGGCDTITVRTDVYKLVRKFHKKGDDVMFEGLLCSDEVHHTIALHTDGLPLTVIGLTTPIEECLRRVNSRRREKNPEAEEVNPRNTEAKHRSVVRSMERFVAAGLTAVWMDNKAALDYLVRELGLRMPE